MPRQGDSTIKKIERSSSTAAAEQAEGEVRLPSDTFLWRALCGGATCAISAMVLQILNGGAYGEVRKGNQVTGYWGPTDSSVEWCEENYVTNHYIAEFFNSTTSLVPFLFGAAFLIQSLHVSAEKRFLFAGVSSAMVGLGSIAFHGTMRRYTQAMDEVPMVWVVTVANYATYEMKNKEISSRVLPWFIFVALAVMTYLNVFTTGMLAAATFHASFSPMFLIYLFFSYQAYVSTTRKDIKLPYALSFIALPIAGVCWAVDNVFCGIVQNLPFGVPNPQLHAWGWHIFVAYGAYCVQIASLATRLEFLGKSFRMEWTCFGLVPYYTLLDDGLVVDTDSEEEEGEGKQSPSAARSTSRSQSKTSSITPARASSSRKQKRE